MHDKGQGKDSKGVFGQQWLTVGKHGNTYCEPSPPGTHGTKTFPMPKSTPASPYTGPPVGVVATVRGAIAEAGILYGAEFTGGTGTSILAAAE